MTELREAFLDDHRVMTGDIAALREAVAARDLERCRELASRLDREAGPHIEFEERYLFPVLVEVLGHSAVHLLYREHHSGRAALCALNAATSAAPPDYDELDEQLATMADHALTCGALSSHVEAIDADERATLLRRLYELRAQHHRWTELPESDS